MRILQIVHAWPPESVGGTEVYVRWLSQALAGRDGDRVTVLAREADPARPELEVRHSREGRVDVYRVNNTFRTCRSFDESYRHPDLLAAVDRIVEQAAPDVAHVHHLTCLSTRLVSALTARGAGVVMTLHDFWLMCHRGQRVDIDGSRCDAGVSGTCRRCIPGGTAAIAAGRRVQDLLESLPLGAAAARAAASVVRRWTTDDRAAAVFDARRVHMREAVDPVALFLAPSATVLDAFAAWGLPPDRLRRHELGIAPRFVRRTGSPGRPLRLGFVGSWLPSKAPHLVIEAAARLPAGLVTVDLIGAPARYHGDASYQAQLDPWLRHPCVRRAGAAAPDDMPGRLAHLDALVVPSTWLENSPLVIREAFAAGLPVVASRLGGMAESVRHGVDGLLFPPGDVAALADALRRLATDTGLYHQLAAGIVPPRTIADDAEATRGVYDEIRNAPRPAPRGGAR